MQFLLDKQFVFLVLILWLLHNLKHLIIYLTSILYGGSCKPTNAKELFAKPDVDGGLIGGAALKADSFMGIIEAFD